MSLKVSSAASTYCVSIDEIKSFLRLTTASTDEDALLVAFIKGAESYAENYTKRSICKKQFQYRMDDFPDSVVTNERYGDIELPRPPLTTVSSEVIITYISDATALTASTVDSTAYTIDFYSEPGVIYPSYDNEWPEPSDVPNAVTVTYYSGYSTPANVPDPIKQWVKLRVGAMYEHRESLMVGTGNFVTELPHSYVDGLLDEFVVQSV